MAVEEELRIALTMNGGVSLAVWIGGVAAEYGRLVARDGPYAKLLALLDYDPRIDVIAGSSAGGVNGAYLGMAMTRYAGADLWRSMAGLRAIWIDDGAIDALLRDPVQAAAPSLLDGDGYYYAHLRQAFAGLNTARRPIPPEAVPIDLILTATLLTGTPQRLMDDYGSPIPDETHRAHFRFRRNDRGVDHFDHPLVADKLALAARSTSSFPAAFEPSFCPVRASSSPQAPDRDPDALPASSADGRPYMNGIVDIDQWRFLVDGGVLDNKPLDLAIDAIFAQPANRLARRVLAYIVPDPGTVATDPPDLAQPVPTLLPTFLAASVEVPSNQSVADDIARLRTHNDRVRRKRQLRSTLTRYMSPDAIDTFAARMFPAYRDARLDRLAHGMIDRLNIVRASRGIEPLAMAGGGGRLHDAIIDAGEQLSWLPRRAPMDPDGVAERRPVTWGWGEQPLAYLSRLALDLLVRLEKTGASADTGSLWRDVTTFVRRADELRPADGGDVSDDRRMATVAAEMDRAAEDGGQGVLLRMLNDAEDGQAASAGELAYEIATFVVAVNGIFADVPRPGTLPYSEEWDNLHGLLSYLVRGGEAGPEPIVERLLAFTVVQQTLGGEVEPREQIVHFIQVSGNDDPLIGRRTAVQKLNGTQLAHFGAFYKASWRANDWMWGRRDAVPRILRVLLEPARVRQVASLGDPVSPVDFLLAKLGEIGAELAGAADAAAFWSSCPDDHVAVRAELAYVAVADGDLPPNLPRSIVLLSRLIETRILAGELPMIAAAVAVEARSARPSPVAAGLVEICRATPPGAPLPLDVAATLLDWTVLGSERWQEEVGTDPATFTVAKALAVAVTTLRGGSGVAALGGKAIALLRLPSLIFYGMAHALLIGSRLAVAVGAILIAASGVLIATWLVWYDRAPYPPLLLYLAGLCLLTSFVVNLIRAAGSGRWWSRAAVATYVSAAAAGVVIAIERGVVDRAVRTWPWLHIALVEAVVILLPLAWGVIRMVAGIARAAVRALARRAARRRMRTVATTGDPPSAA